MELGGGSAAVNLPLPHSPGSVHALQGNGEFCRETKVLMRCCESMKRAGRGQLPHPGVCKRLLVHGVGGNKR